MPMVQTNTRKWAQNSSVLSLIHFDKDVDCNAINFWQLWLFVMGFATEFYHW